MTYIIYRILHELIKLLYFYLPNQISMATFLFDKIIFGPVYSRRLGVSLGINLLPPGRKICTFSCIYCECGVTRETSVLNEKMAGRESVKQSLYLRLEEMAAFDQHPDVITFAGNGEPTLHPEFPGIIDDTIEVRDTFFPDAGIAVLSNSTTLGDEKIRNALMKTDHKILKLDSAFDTTIRALNQPRINITARQIIDNMKLFKGDLIIQTMFIRGLAGGIHIDNTTGNEIIAWLDAIKDINPSEVQIYTVSRDAPEGNDISKIPPDELEIIAARVNELGIKTQVSN